jgi:hypothetical protein
MNTSVLSNDCLKANPLATVIRTDETYICHICALTRFRSQPFSLIEDREEGFQAFQ